MNIDKQTSVYNNNKIIIIIVIAKIRETDSHLMTLHHSIFYRPDTLPHAQPTVSKH